MEEHETREQFIRAMFRFKKAWMVPQIKAVDINITELIVMHGITRGNADNDKSFNTPGIQSFLQVTKAAVSKIVNSLEKKGYVTRETNKANRRKIVVELTPAGEEVLNEAQASLDTVLGEIFERFGEDNTKHFITLLDLLSDITDAVQQENGFERDRA
jgi:DNA-binding MarR family transcriptional regulator